jgi:hypothetical protein
MWLVLLYSLAAIYALWILFVFSMATLRAKRDGIASRVALLLAMPTVLCALILDVVLNYSVFVLLTLDFPKIGEWTFSQRLSRLVRQTGWRSCVAGWLARNLLDPYDPSGKHVR